MRKKICIVTGANAGIGKKAVEQIAGEDFHVIMACRNMARGEAALNNIKERNPSASVELMIVDMGVMGSVRNMAEQFSSKYDRLDVLIHNAAVFNVSQKKSEKTSEGIEAFWATNHLGPVLLTSLLLAKLKKSENGRIITISSKGLLAKPFLKVDLDDPEFNNKSFNVVNAYYQSKIAQMMFTYWVAEKLKHTAITANCIRVTAVQIDVSRHPELSSFMKWVYKQKSKRSITPEEMANTYTYLACDKGAGRVTGKIFDEHNLEVKPNKYINDKGQIDLVMSLTRKYIPEIEGI
ncbi:MAG: SDR family NAD(P)-dependent oxidoreductase [Spirochaetales bacterium]|uniref:SDR family NAD(P)-dependent oxidoreductase n=1 Tax=Candidatus Thalassospirochaeta sargassi TaxID=3119039 RepID=A0AAJ1IF14_9SPIO|nr:SDR family NAD(P)-dependent oxidoreductase [Spirochaetales bacterium]